MKIRILNLAKQSKTVCLESAQPVSAFRGILATIQLNDHETRIVMALPILFEENKSLRSNVIQMKLCKAKTVFSL